MPSCKELISLDGSVEYAAWFMVSPIVDKLEVGKIYSIEDFKKLGCEPFLLRGQIGIEKQKKMKWRCVE